MKEINSFYSRAAEQAAGKRFLDGEEALSYGQLIERIERLTTVLDERGIRPGQLVLILVENPARFVEIFLGLLVNGVGAVIANPGTAAHEFHSLLDNTDPAGIIVDQSLFSGFGLAGSDYEVLVLFTVFEGPPRGLLGKLLGKAGRY